MFLFQLARSIGKTAEWIEQNMSAGEFVEWQEFISAENRAIARERKAQERRR